jgi:ADP-ribosyl-[dinitrogen reductase] hydrolase
MPDPMRPRLLPSTTDPEIASLAAGFYLHLRQLQPTGHVTRTLETALWAISHTADFETALIAATSPGGDADSIGAVTGMIAGAMFGLSSVPARWLHRLAWSDKLVVTSERLLAVAS